MAWWWESSNFHSVYGRDFDVPLYIIFYWFPLPLIYSPISSFWSYMSLVSGWFNGGAFMCVGILEPTDYMRSLGSTCPLKRTSRAFMGDDLHLCTVGVFGWWTGDHCPNEDGVKWSLQGQQQILTSLMLRHIRDYSSWGSMVGGVVHSNPLVEPILKPGWVISIMIPGVRWFTHWHPTLALLGIQVSLGSDGWVLAVVISDLYSTFKQIHRFVIMWLIWSSPHFSVKNVIDWHHWNL